MNDTVNWSEQTDSLGREVGNWILTELRLPAPVLDLLEREYLGNSVMAYGFLAAALVAGWFLGLMASLVAGRIIRVGLGRFSPDFAKGVARAVSGPLHLALLCWTGVLGTAFLAQPPAAAPAPSEKAKAAVTAKAMPRPAVSGATAPASAPAAGGVAKESNRGPEAGHAEGVATPPSLAQRLLQSWKPHYARGVLRGIFSFVMVLALFWIGARIARFVWKTHVEPWVESSVKAPEKHYFPIVYRVLIFSWWFWALLSGIASLGFDSRQSVGAVLAYSAARNTIAEYLSFLGLVVLTILSARSLFTMVTRQLTRVMARQAGGAKPIQLEDTWFAGLERPLVYLIGLIGMRLAAEILHPNPGELLNIHGIVTTAIHLCITAVLVWIAFILIDKLFEYFLLPLAKLSEVVEIQLVYLGRKTAKIGVAVIGFIFMIKSVGQDPGTLLAGLGIGGLAVSFAARDAVSPFVAGISLYATRPFRMGDFIHLDEHTEGIVEEIGMSATKVRKRDGTLLTIPNNNLTMSVVHNRTVNKLTRDQIPISLHMDTRPEERDRVMKMLLDSSGRVFGVKNPSVGLTSYGNESIALSLSYWVEDAYRLNTVRNALLMDIDARLRELGVRLSIPTVAHVFSPGVEGRTEVRRLAEEAVQVRGDLQPAHPGSAAGSPISSLARRLASSGSDGGGD